MAGPTHTVLVVDDEFTIVESLTDVLSFEGYHVISAPNGAKALAMLEQSTPAVLLVDFMMPVMDGVQFIRRVRADARYHDLPIIMMTAAPAGLPKTERPWDALLVKPFELDKLLTTIQQLLK